VGGPITLRSYGAGGVEEVIVGFGMGDVIIDETLDEVPALELDEAIDERVCTCVPTLL
jgi:hypothetical protein